MSETCRIERWSGRATDKPKTVFRGELRAAREKIAPIARDLRQGSVRLIGHNGETIIERRAFRNRTKW